MNSSQRSFIVLSLLFLSSCAHPPAAEKRGDDLLIVGKRVASRPSDSWDVGSLPMNMIRGGDYVLTSDAGYHQSLWSIRIADGKGVSHVDYPNDRTGAPERPSGEIAEPAAADSESLKSNGLYYGLAASPDYHIYAAQGAHDSIAILTLDPATGALAPAGFIRTLKQDFPAGLALDTAGRLYVSNNASGEGDPLKLQGSVAIYDPAARRELGRYTFADSHNHTSNFPLGITVRPDGTRTYVAAERDDAVYVLDTADPRTIKPVARISTGAHPISLLLSPDQRTLYVANALSDTISAVDTATNSVTQTILLRPRMARDVPGVTPTSLILAPDQKTLYATLGDMNAIGVIDLPSAQLKGYLPAGWYPTAAVLAAPDRLLVSNAKGWSARNPNNVPDSHNPRKRASTLTVLEGNVSAVSLPASPSTLDKATQQVLADNRLLPLDHPQSDPLAPIGLRAGKIKHVFYIVKENRTYDQVFGDIPTGNGDPALTLFGKEITPNQHALAERFVLLDNLYCCGEVSGDGWDWSTQGMANDYVVRNIPYNYSHRGRRFDFEGQNNGYPSAGSPAVTIEGHPLTHPSFKNGAPPIPDVASTRRHIWDAAAEAGITLRNYGFFSDNDEAFIGIKGGPDNWPSAVGLSPGGHDLAGLTDVDYRRFDLDYPDSDAPDYYFHLTADKNCLWPTQSFGRPHSTSRFSEWNREFQMMLARDPSGAAVPNLTLIRLPNDHSLGARSGRHSPASFVADNDYALGQFIQAISQSPIWQSTAIFVIEDDAQSGVDHVDAHRTNALVISPWIKPASIDHRFYNTDSMLKTIELLLGLKPLSQYDAVADPILNWSRAAANAASFEATRPSKELIAQINPSASSLKKGDPRREMARASDRMDFSHEDAAPARELDEITWKTIKGPFATLPTLRGVRPNEKDDDD